MGALPVAGSDEQKRTNEIGMAVPLLNGCQVAGKVVTADALLTQRNLAQYLIGRGAHYKLYRQKQLAQSRTRYRLAV